MSIKELMIEDWVQSKSNKYPFQVISINRNGFIRIEVGDEQFSKLITEFEPIPLTPEILEKNGYHFDEIDGSFWMNGVPTIFGRKAPFIMFATIEIKYIHQLQHALRLCRIEKEIQI